MRVIVTICLLMFALSLYGVVAPEDVVVVVNENDEGSVLIGEYYCNKRGIPEENIIRLDVSLLEEITWEEYVKEIHNPLKWELLKRGWLDGLRKTGTDLFGRENYAVKRHGVGYLVVCRGVPFKILHDKKLLIKESKLPKKMEFHRTNASVDGELALLAMENTAVVGVVKNPYFKMWKGEEKDKERVIRVARLDGPSEEGVKGMIDGVLIAEREGLMGRVYVDASGPFKMGNKWMSDIWGRMVELGFDGEFKEGVGFKLGDRFEAPALYFGWWSEHVGGPFLDESVKFVPGGIGVHLHSRSAEKMRSKDLRWVGPLIERGVCATLGNVDEPYLQCTHYLQLLWKGLESGMSWGEAGYEALPFLSWQAVLIGDPLYEPLKKGLTEQMRRIRVGGGTEYRQYAMIRQMNLLKKSGRVDEAVNMGKVFFQKEQGLALQFELSQLLAEQGKVDEAVARLKFMNFYHVFPGETQGLAREIGDFLLMRGDTETGLGVYESLIENSDMGVDVRKAYAKRGMHGAKQAGVGLLGAHWKKVVEGEVRMARLQ